MEELQLIGIQPGHRVALLGMSVILLGFVLELVRRDLLREKYALLWLATSVVGLTIGVVPDLLVAFAQLMRFQLLTALFVFSFIFTLAIVLGFTVIISRLSERNRELAQEVALLNHEMGQIRRKRDA